MSCPTYDHDHHDDCEEPIGSCDNCGVNIYEEDSYDGLCSQCHWSERHEQERDDDVWLGLE